MKAFKAYLHVIKTTPRFVRALLENKKLHLLPRAFFAYLCWVLYKSSGISVFGKLLRIFDKLRNELIINVNRLYFFLPDLSSLYILFSEDWFWDYVKLEKGDVFLDIGAHVGKYSFLASRKVGKWGKVIALEPHPENFKLLNEGIKKNSLTNVISLQVGAWDKNQLIRLQEGYMSGTHTLRSVGEGREILVKVEPVDKILQRLRIEPNWIKIDVEGAELKVLHGLRETLKRSSVSIICEISRENEEKVCEFMRELGYTYKKIKEAEYPDRVHYVFKKHA